jgi:phage-related minor tail protein
MSLDLATLKIGVDVSAVKSAIADINKLGEALGGLAKPLAGVAKSTQQVEKVADETKKASDKIKKANDDTEASGSKAARAVEKQVTTLKVMRNQTIDTADGMLKLGDSFTKGQSSQLAAAKLMGATTAELKELAKAFQDMNKITGVNPFDKSVGHMKALQQEVKELENINKLMASGLNLSQKEVAGLSRDIVRLTEAMKAEGSSVKQINAEIEKLTKNTIELSRAKAKEELQVKAMEELRRQEAKAALEAENEKATAIAKTNALMKKQEELLKQQAFKSQYLNEGFSPNVANQGASLRMQGLTDDQARVILNNASALEKQRRASMESAKATQYLVDLEQRLNTYFNESSNTINQRYTDALAKLRRNIERSGLSAEAAKKKYDELSVGIKKVAEAENKRNADNLARAVSVQMGDVGISLASGQNPFIVMIQQGDQIRAAIQQANLDAKELSKTMGLAAKQIASSFRDASIAIGGFFKGAIVSSGDAVINFFASIVGRSDELKQMRVAMESADKAGQGLYASLLRIATLGFGTIVFGIAAALVAIPIGMIQAIRENDRFVRSMALTNGALGITTTQGFAAATALENMGFSAGKSIEVMQEMGKEGDLTATQINMVAKAAIELEKYGGVAIEKTVKTFSDLQKDPVDALVKLARTTGMVNIETIQQIEQLQRLGYEYEAGQRAVLEYERITREQVATIKDELSGLGLFWADITKMMGDAWDSFIKGLTRKDGGDATGALKRMVDEAQDRVDDIQSNLRQSAWFGIKTDDRLLKQAQERLNVLRTELRARQQAAESMKLQAEYSKQQRDLDEGALKLIQANMSERERLVASIRKNSVLASQTANPESRSGYLDAVAKDMERLRKLDEVQVTKTRENNDAEKDRIKTLAVLEKYFLKSEDYLPTYSENYRRIIEAGLEFGESTENVNAALRALAAEQPKNIRINREYTASQAELKREHEAVLRAQQSLSEESEKLNMQVADSITQVEIEASLIGKTNEEKDKTIKLLKIEAEYRKEIADIQRKLPRGGAEAEELQDDALRRRADRIRVVMGDASNKAAEDYLKKLQEISKSISDVIATAIIDGGGAAKKKLRDLIVNALRQRITLQIDAFINPIVNSFANAMMGGPAGAAAAGASGGLSAGAGIGIGAAIGKFAAAPITLGSVTLPSLATMGPYALAALAAYKVGGKFYDQGFNKIGARQLQDDLGPLGGIGAGLSADVTNALTKLGISDKLANILSGSTVISKLFGRSQAKVDQSGISGTFTGTGASNLVSYTDLFQKGGVFRSDKRSTNISALDEGLRSGIEAQYLTVKNSVEEMAGVLGIGTEAISSFSYNMRLNLNGLSNEDAAQAIADEFKRISDAMVSSIVNLTEFQRYGETASDTISRMSSTLGQMNEAFKLLGWNVYQSSVSGFKAADSFVQLFGSLDQATEALSVYYDKFYSAQEKNANVTEVLRKEFEKFGVAMPDSILNFRKLVDEIKASGDQKLLADLISVSGAFSQMIEFQADSMSDYTNLQRQILELQGDTVTLREMELKTLDATAAALQKQVWALEDAKKAQEDYTKFVDQYTSRGAKLREFVTGRQTEDTSFSAILSMAGNGDLSAIDKIEGAALREIEKARSNAVTLQEAQTQEQIILAQVMEFAEKLEKFSGSSMEQLVLETQKSSVEATVKNTEALNLLNQRLLTNTGTLPSLTTGTTAEGDLSLQSRIDLLEVNTKTTALHLAKLVRIFERLTPDGDSLVVST